MVHSRAVCRIWYVWAWVYFLERAPVVACGDRRAGAGDHGDTGLEEAIRPTGDHLVGLRPDEGSLETAQRAAGDIGRDGGHQHQVLLRLVPQDHGCTEPLDDARLRRIRGKRRIEYLRKATDANR